MSENTIRRSYTCPRCKEWAESEVSLMDGYTVCPLCENEIVIPVSMSMRVKTNIELSAQPVYPLWISTDDRLPDDEIEVLACWNGDIFIAWHDIDTWWTGDAPIDARVMVSFWMDLPAAPEERKLVANEG